MLIMIHSYPQVCVCVCVCGWGRERVCVKVGHLCTIGIRCTVQRSYDQIMMDSTVCKCGCASDKYLFRDQHVHRIQSFFPPPSGYCINKRYDVHRYMQLQICCPAHGAGSY
ncbi:hypothetical protein Mp_8g04150 [Marchantia polymorpha subsp. ruderalis]|uniref:Uncharacterized protein n=1 Tax=Marchantia polymorpha TaxID=3197 RepID=A0A2R6XJK5_MARPO|nr:hypothetical protein MARPO_0012s0204 [Marchantia polymorpha]BBN18638.1 hypothetical protein Mp_8g04150 [Marchantia polymorpha subsp. ruderalis]|eukprot:PTQ46285.1 hypothetical protein MARPO_0012s0204 [Marchantia polymorpha]